MLASLDPMGAPLVTQIVAGNTADDGPFTFRRLTRYADVLGQTGLLYIGDSKMEALATRAHIVAGGDYYLTPLSHKGTKASCCGNW
jgi:transposase